MSGGGGKGRFALGCALVGLLALALRLDFIAAYWRSPLFGELFIDPRTYDTWASLVARGEDWTDGGVYPRAPLYIWFLASLYRLFGHTLLLSRLVQAALGAASCVLVAILGRRFLPRKEALGGALLAALSWPLIFFDAQLLFPALIVFLELLFLLSLPANRRGWERHLLSGVILGLLCLVNPLSLLFLPAWVLRLLLGRTGGGGRTLPAAAAFAAGCLLALLPATAHNRLAGGEWTLISANGGYNLFIGNNAAADGISVWASEEAIAVDRDVPSLPAAASRHYSQKALNWMKGNPFDAASLLVRKAYYLVNAREIPSNFLLDRMRKLVPSRAGWAALLHFGILGPLALAGCLFAVRLPGARPILLFLALSAAGTVIFFVNARYRAPLLPLLYLMAAHGAGRLLAGLKAGGRSALGPLLLLAAAAILVNSRGWGVTDRSVEAPLYSELGRAMARQGEVLPAIEELRTALSLDPGRGEDRYLLAVLLVRAGKGGEAGKELRRIVDRDPDDFRAWNALGNLALLRGEASEAAAFYERALEIRPGYGLAARNLEEAKGRLLEGEGAAGGATFPP